jgi:hypothetical protein
VVHLELDMGRATKNEGHIGDTDKMLEKIFFLHP